MACGRGSSSSAILEEARFTGDWDWSLGELETQLAGELERVDRAWYLGNSLVFKAWRGEATEEEWATWEPLAESHDDPQAAADYDDMRAARALAEGRLLDARRHAIDLVRETASPEPGVAEPIAARAALWSGDLTGAIDDLAGLDATGMHGPAIELRRATIRAGICGTRGTNRRSRFCGLSARWTGTQKDAAGMQARGLKL